MNIKEHIEAGHYPRDSRGRALVPTTTPGVTAVISDTDAGHCPEPCLLGWLIGDDRGGDRIAWWRFAGESFVVAPDLLPPPPRKVTVKAWARIGPGGTIRKVAQHHRDAIKVGVTCETVGEFFNDHIVELTGEYEEPWS